MNNNFKVELAYRYLNMGSTSTPPRSIAARRVAAPVVDRAPTTPCREIDSHDFKLGMRWMLAPEQQAPVYHAAADAQGLSFFQNGTNETAARAECPRRFRFVRRTSPRGNV